MHCISFRSSTTEKDQLSTSSIPVFYSNPLHQYNYNVKFNFWRGELVDWATGISEFFSRVPEDEESGTTTKKLRLENSATQISFNLHPEWTSFSLSGSYTAAHTRVTGDKLIEPYTTRSVHDIALDLSYSVSHRFDLTVGAGSLREIGFSAYEDAKFGLGASTGIYFPNGFISKLALGTHYTPTLKSFQTLLGLQFM